MTVQKSAVIYLRVSTSKQANDGVSLDAQLERAKKWCDYKGYSIKEVFTDGGITGTSIDKRPAFNNAIKAVVKGDAFVFYSMSRFARSAVDAITTGNLLRSRGVDVVSISEDLDTTTAAGKLMFNMLAVLAQFGSDKLKEDTKNGMQRLKEKGQLVGSIPFGFSVVEGFDEKGKNVKKLVPNNKEQVTIKLIHELRFSTNKPMSFQKIAYHLDKLPDHKARNGKDWQPKCIDRIVNNQQHNTGDLK